MRHPTVGSQEADWKATRLLVFGLDDQFRFLARQTFRKMNVREVVAFSEPADTAGLMSRGFDLLLLDLSVGSEDGLAVLEQLRRPVGNPHENVPVLVIAVSSQKDVVDRARVLGIEGTVPKPVSGHELAHRVADTLANPQRLPVPSGAVAKPKMNFIKDPDPLPDLPQVKPQTSAPLPEVAALAARLAEREAKSNPERPDRSGPWTALSDVAAPAAPPPAAKPVQPPPPPAPKPVAATAPKPVPPKPLPSKPMPMLSGEAAAPARRPRGGKLELDDLPPNPKRPSGGKLELDDLAPAPKPKDNSAGIEVAGIKPDLDAEAKRRAAEKRRQQWQEAMEKTGHTARKGGDIAGLDLTAVVAEHGQWLQTNGAEGKRATFSGMDLAGANLAGAVLANATFREVDLSDACLADARLDGSDFRYAKMEATDLGGANLGVAALRHAKLRLSNMENAVLRGCDLSGATLTGARLAGADMKGAILIGADLREADLSKVDGLTSAQIEKSLCDMSTRLPPGVFRPAKAEG